MGISRTKRPTLREVADHAGVSTATVSLVVNGKAAEAGITESTQALVYAAIEKLQYTPNRMASAVVTGRSRMIGVVSVLSRELFDTKFGTRVLSGFAHGAREFGYHFVFLEDILSPDPDEHLRILRRAREMCVEGLILLVDIGHEEKGLNIADQLSELFPVVNVQFTFDPEGIPGFRVDHAGTAKAVVDYLVGLGHRRIGFGTRYTELARSQSSAKLVEERMRFHGLQFDPALVFEIPPWERMEKFVEKVRKTKPTALFTLYDGEAMRAVGALRESGFRIPEDISIIGYGNFPLAKDCCPPLTTYRPPMEEIGRTAIQHLITCIERGEDPTLESSRGLAGTIVERASTGPAKTG